MGPETFWALSGSRRSEHLAAVIVEWNLTKAMIPDRRPRSQRTAAARIPPKSRRDPLRYEKGVLAGSIHDPGCLSKLHGAGIYTIADLTEGK